MVTNGTDRPQASFPPVSCPCCLPRIPKRVEPVRHIGDGGAGETLELLSRVLVGLFNRRGS